MVPAAHTETKRAFEPNIEGSTSFCISAAVTKEFPKPDVVNSSLAASTPEDEAGEPNTSMDNPINVSMKGRIASDVEVSHLQTEIAIQAKILVQNISVK